MRQVEGGSGIGVAGDDKGFERDRLVVIDLITRGSGGGLGERERARKQIE